MDSVGNSEVGFTEYIMEHKRIIRSKKQWSEITLITRGQHMIFVVSAKDLLRCPCPVDTPSWAMQKTIERQLSSCIWMLFPANKY
jgi:hypothetical protein